jgi:outer membrane lipoprotein-sorting protein
MKRLFLPGILLSAVLLTGSFSRHLLTVERISAAIITRQATQGKSVTLKGDIFYQRNGNMITHFTYPMEYIVVANRLGETKVYDPVKNTVMQYQNFLFSTQSSQFYYFLSGRISDMGLTNIGYVQDKTYNENGMLVTEWKLKTPNKKALIQRIKIVYDGQRPVYMHYQDSAGKVFRKVYYYNYQMLEAYSFPATTTEITYDKKDSTVSKTNYTDFKLNERTDETYFNYSIPANAKIEQ